MLISQKLRFFIAWIDPWPPKDKNSHDDSEQQSERFRRVVGGLRDVRRVFFGREKGGRDGTGEHHRAPLWEMF